VSAARLEALASILCRYSLEVQPGDVVRVHGPASEAPFFVAVTRELTRLGAHPMLRPTLPSVEAAILSMGSDEQLTTVTELDRLESEVPDKTLTIWADANTRYLSAVAPDRQGGEIPRSPLLLVGVGALTAIVVEAVLATPW